MGTATTASTTVELTRDEILQIIEEEACARRGMSAQELLSAYRAGTLPDVGEVADLIVLSDLLSRDDPIFKAA